ncbi:rhodanese-like domain-containing protein [uncultured Pseudonocardia sp.]|uniref:rhodanese-like domain-containing protein n=1 Tax=uncultured Pseudonocardia sp. TaxID=211455 RepID=UPI0026162316|nr:rhodanese-like domain-containing protein [uncultured Pseudonocardia sp.]
MQVQEIDVEQFATDRRDDTVVLDVRSAEEFTGGHVPGAVNVPLEQVVAEPGRYSGREVYVICQSGGRSAKAAQALAGAGARAVSVAGGTAGWIEAGRPVESGDR